MATPKTAPGTQIRIGSTGGAALKPESTPTRITQTGPNGDETAFANYRGNFTKGMAHNMQTGLLQTNADYNLMRAILNSANHSDYELLPQKDSRKFVNPQAGKAHNQEGPSPQSVKMLAAPSLESPETATEAVELYWMALLRDVPFREFTTDFRVASAIDELNAFRAAHDAFTGPLDGGHITPHTIFRGIAPGDTTGPLLSQFLLFDVPYGSLLINQRQETARPAMDYMTSFQEFVAIQNGYDPAQPDPHPERLYIHNMRGLAHYVHLHAFYEAYLNACLILLGGKAPFNPGNPYNGSATQAGFSTFGGPHILSLVTEVAARALKTVWWQKWNVHRRLRPEAYGGLVDRNLLNSSNPIFGTNALQEVRKKHGTRLLPMAFAEGSPMHPSYGAGHATVAGACVTVLKAFFDESAVIENPIQAAAGGTGLEHYFPSTRELPLTVGGELNKLAANIALGCNMAGVHWRSDYTESLKLGEQVAIHFLDARRDGYFEDYTFSFTSFDGQRVAISKAGVGFL